MKGLGRAKILLLIAIVFLVLSIVLSVVSLFPVDTANNQTLVLVNDTFNLTPNETYRQGLGSFWGNTSSDTGNISQRIFLSVQCPEAFYKNFSIINYNGTVTYNGIQLMNYTDKDIAYNFNASTGYYEAVFSNSTNSGTIHFTASVQEPKTLFPYFWLNEGSKIMFLLSLGSAILILLKITLPKLTKTLEHAPSLPWPNKTFRKYLLTILLLSLVIWLFLLATNSYSSLGTVENWYTDHARDSYVSSLFLKDGFSIFNEPLGKLASLDNSAYKFVTWPQMPHLYPLGSVFLFLPFGVLLQNGFNSVLVYKIEVAVFLIFATACLYFFLKNFLIKDLREPEDTSRFRLLKILRLVLLEALGVFIIYLALIFYAADGMFDSVALLFCLFALSMFMMKRYDYFFLLIAVAVFVKYQAGIFLLPLIIVGLMKLIEGNRLRGLLRNKAVIAGAVFGGASVFTAYLSAPYLIATGPQFVTNGINAFSPNAQISWPIQSSAVLLTLCATLVYAFYMLNKNSLLSLSALFLLLPSFMLPYFQSWYFPYLFIYALIPQRKRELEATIIWLIFMVTVIYLGGLAYNIP